MLKPVVEQRPVREAGQVIVEGLVRQFGFERLALADVSQNAGKERRSVCGAGRHAHFQRHFRAIAP